MIIAVDGEKAFGNMKKLIKKKNTLHIREEVNCKNVHLDLLFKIVLKSLATAKSNAKKKEEEEEEKKKRVKKKH